MKKTLGLLVVLAATAYAGQRQDSRGTWIDQTAGSGVRMSVMVQPSAAENARRADGREARVFTIHQEVRLSTGRGVLLDLGTALDLTRVEQDELRAKGYVVRFAYGPPEQ